MTWCLCWYRNRLGWCVGDRSRLDFGVGDRNLLDFRVGIRIALVLGGDQK